MGHSCSSHEVSPSTTLEGGKPNEIPEKETEAETGATPEDSSTLTFKPEKIDFHQEENEKNHHTSKYEKDELVIRRGQSFTLSVSLKSEKSFDTKKDEILLCFEIGDVPVEDKGTFINVKVVPSLDGVKDWAAQIVLVDNNTVKLQIMTSPAAVVGKYQISVKTKTDVDGKELKATYSEIQPVYILFNAWCKDDDVYMPDEEEKQEYVLNEEGMIWRNSYHHYKGTLWYFGQFEEVVFDCALFLLHNLSKQDTYLLGNPVVVSRALSAFVNSNVLEGNWSGDYEGGKRPTFWDGSSKILEQFMAKKTPVKYGQCWVYSGVLTTLGRTLGIPTRSVTNISSAHDTDGSITIDKYFDAVTNEMHSSPDSIWNFHVWNDCWFKRPDLPAGYDGWQAVDSTPQEISTSGILFDNVYCCGPSPVKAIKEGDLAYGNDTGFIFAEVNGDKIIWSVDASGKKEVTDIDKNAVGDYLITKRVGDITTYPYGMDIMNEYKYSGEKEREVVARAISLGSKSSYLGEKYGENISKDVQFYIDLPFSVMLGKDVSFTLHMNNTSSENRTVSANIQVRAAFYTGVVNPTPCKGEKLVINLPPDTEKQLTLSMSAEDYIDFMAEDKTVFKVYFQAVVTETNQKFMRDKDFVFYLPPHKLQCPEEVQMNIPFKVTLSFSNPLSRPLTGGEVNIEGSRVISQTVEQKTVPALGEFSEEFEVSCKTLKKNVSGKAMIHASFTSNLLSLNDATEVFFKI